MADERYIKYSNGDYTVTDCGKVFSYKSGKRKQRRLSKDTGGYLYANFSDGAARCKLLIHRLVAEAFIPNPEALPQINHKDGDKCNNHVSNLEWCTPGQNMQHSYDKGLNWHKGERHTMSKLTPDDVKTIRVLLSIGEKQSTIAKAFNISQQKVSQLNRGKTWKHV